MYLWSLNSSGYNKPYGKVAVFRICLQDIKCIQISNTLMTARLGRILDCVIDQAADSQRHRITQLLSFRQDLKMKPSTQEQECRMDVYQLGFPWFIVIRSAERLKGGGQY